MKPIPGADELGETVEQRVQARIDTAKRRREQTKTVRDQFNQRRRHGLRARHAARAAHHQEDSMTTFGAWLANQADRQDPIGDLARDYLESCGCGRGSCSPNRPQTVKSARKDLNNHGAIPEAHHALDEAAAEWRSAHPNHA